MSISIKKLNNLIILTVFLFFYCALSAQPRIINGVSVPSDFPLFVPTINIDPSPGKIFISNMSGASNFIMIFENDGTPYYYKKVANYSSDFKVQPNGLLSRHSTPHGGFLTIDNNFEIINVHKVLDYSTDKHDFFITPEGTFLMIGIRIENRDMSTVVPDGQTYANLIGNVIQEIDADDNILFQWKASEYFNVIDAINVDLTSSRIDWVHMNSIALDYDGHILVSSRHLSECTKINRQTGEIIWRLGGVNNEFTFINEDLEFSFQHAFYPVEGYQDHYTIYDNGNHRGQFTRIVEYIIDPANLTAEKIWEFRYTPDLYTSRAGNAQRLPNGNTLINFEQPDNPKAVEVSPDGSIVYEANFSPPLEAHRTFRFDWEGIAEKPYLLTEPMEGSTRLIFNKFGDANVVSYNIYGDPHSDPTTLIASTSSPWYDIDLRPYVNNDNMYFRVTSVAPSGSESDFSNCEVVNLSTIYIGYSDGILGYLDIDDSSDPLWDSSKPGFGSALFFDGIDDFVNCGNDNTLQISGNQITLEAWIKLSQSLQSPFEGVILGKDAEKQNNNAGYRISCSESGIISFVLGNEVWFELSTDSNSVQPEQWFHVAATYDGNVQRIYINGELAAVSSNFNIDIASAAKKNVHIGSSSFCEDRHFPGLIDEVRLWNQAISQNEIQNNMNRQLDEEYYTSPESGLVGYWRFNEGEGQITHDLASDNNLILNGNFNNGSGFWETVVAENLIAESIINDDNHYSVQITDGGLADRDIQLKQKNLLIIKDESYSLEFDAWSDTNKIIGIDISNSQTPWIDYAKIGAVLVTADSSRFQFNFTMYEYSDNQAEFIFLLGGNDINFYLDNVRLTNDISTSVPDDFEDLNEFKIVGNYPNPFNPATTIEYHLPELSKVKISVYDILGRLVNTIFNGTQNGGLNKVQFNGSNLSSGVYIYTIEANSIVTGRKYRDSNKMLFLK